MWCRMFDRPFTVSSFVQPIGQKREASEDIDDKGKANHPKKKLKSCAVAVQPVATPNRQADRDLDSDTSSSESESKGASRHGGETCSKQVGGLRRLLKN